MRIFGYLWALPVTAVGMAIVALGIMTGGSAQLRSGVVEAWGGLPGRLLRGGRFRRGGAAATLGHVILARDRDCLERSRKHELFHVRQYERWGLFLLPTYWLVEAWLWLRGHHPYLDHPMEPPPN